MTGHKKVSDLIGKLEGVVIQLEETKLHMVLCDCGTVWVELSAERAKLQYENCIATNHIHSLKRKGQSK